MADVLIEKGLVGVDEVWGMEKRLYYPELYAGTADLIGVYKGKPAIMDYKTARKIKKKEYVQDYLLQLTAYSLSHNELYGTDIKTGVIFMVDKNMKYKTFVLENTEFDVKKIEWFRRVEAWYEKNSK